MGTVNSNVRQKKIKSWRYTSKSIVKKPDI